MRIIPNHLKVVDNVLHIGGKNCVELADEFGTPTYVYNTERIIDNFNRLHNSLKESADREVIVYYAVKANFNSHILNVLAEHGAHADVLSIYETEFALKTGFESSRILFTGTSVSDETLKYLLERDVLINIDSFSQLKRLAKFAPEGLKISIRWNPGKGAGFNPKVITAGAESHGRPIKFGIEESRVIEACKLAVKLGMRPIGLHQHIGSGWTGDDVQSFLHTVDSTLDMASKMTDVLGYELEQVDFGGGPGIPYTPEQKEFPIDVYTKGICERVKNSGLKFGKICVESGRYIVGDSGVVLTSVNTVEEKSGNLIVGVDAGFNTLVRSVLYDAYHEIIVANRVKGPQERCTIAGPLCETGDLIAVKRLMTKPKEGEVLAILDAGAYGFSMASRYNLQPLPAEVIVPSKKLTTRRENFNDLFSNYNE